MSLQLAQVQTTTLDYCRMIANESSLQTEVWIVKEINKSNSFLTLAS